ncbi:FtsX-like permease family protein [Micromonospora sp. CPCC 205711]|uniref:FtsX-like permease family protein n=1 Tax=Micromonospora sp. CPCC 205547 TaxID=3122400 RepID=UPI002FF0AB54
MTPDGRVRGGAAVGVGEVVRRIRANGGQFVLLAVLTMVATLLVSGVPRLVNRQAERGLRESFAGQPAQVRDLTYFSPRLVAAGGGGSLLADQRADLDTLQAAMPAEVRSAVGSRWFTADIPPSRVSGPDLAAKNLLVDLGLRTVPGIREAGTLVDGRWPDEATAADQPVQVALAADVARPLNLRVGSRLTLAAGETLPGAPAPTQLRVVGLFQPTDPADGSWDDLFSLLRIVEPQGDGEPFTVAAVISGTALDRQAAAGRPVQFSWRYRVDATRFDVRELTPLVDGVRRMSRETGGRTFYQRLDIPLGEFVDGMAAARTLLAVIGAGVLATLAGLVVLATGSAVRRRRSEFTLLRARGGTVGAGVRRSLAESLLVAPPAAVLGWLLGTLVPGPPGDVVALAGLFTVLVTLALPVATAAAPTGVVGRRSGTRSRPSAHRVTVELGVLLLAVLGVVLLRRRGLTLGEVDPLLVGVPVLLAVAAAVVVIRLYPWPLRLAGRLAARARGSVAFLGTARADAAVVTAPLVVVVLAIGTAGFCAVVATGVEAGRDAVADGRVPADALVRGERFAPDTGARLVELPGVRSAAPLLAEPAQRLAKDSDGVAAAIRDVSVLLVDGPALARTAREAGRDVRVPAALLAPAGTAGPLPAVVSPAVAADLAAAGLDSSAFVTVQGQRYEFRVADRADAFPMLETANGRFIVLPWQALPHRDHAVVPTGYLVAGDDLDAATLRRAGDEGQARFQRSGAVVGKDRPLGVRVVTWTQIRRELGEGGVNGVLAFGFAAGAGAGAVLGLLAIAFTVLAGARSRGQMLSRLRTLGLSRRQWRGMLLVELAPLVGAAVLTGALVGALLPLLLIPVLGLSAFTSGAPVRVAFSPGLVAAVVALGAVALGFAVAVEALNNRRLRLGEVLRLGEES